MVAHGLVFKINRSLRLAEANKFCRDKSSLVHQLIKAVLPVRAGLSKDDRTGVDSSIESLSSLTNAFTVTFHVKLLDMRWESDQCLRIRQDGS
jgi:hypothetical protein